MDTQYIRAPCVRKGGGGEKRKVGDIRRERLKVRGERSKDVRGADLGIRERVGMESREV